VKLLVLLLFIFCNNAFGQIQKVGVFRNITVKRILISYGNGTYNVEADSVQLSAILPDEFYDIRFLSSTEIEVYKGVDLIDTFTSINFIASSEEQYLAFTPKEPIAKERRYEDDFVISPNETGLTIVNNVTMNNYLGGVVESEGGNSAELEYMKIQATISRTYALKNLNRHKNQGFSLCDQTHCQAYFSMLRYRPKIDLAVRMTEGEIIVDGNDYPVDAFFHANCGGQTSETDQIWNEKIDYFPTFKDTFCIYTKQATWEKRIEKDKWRVFMVSKYQYPENDSVLGPLMYTFNQDQRMTFFQTPALGIPLRDIRDEYRLKSTFFNCYLDGDFVVLRGRGFGHGVGLCQEGAMRMARCGFHYTQIAQYYYPSTKLINRDQYIFFRQKVTGFCSF
jgi:stage II sporulation protein D